MNKKVKIVIKDAKVSADFSGFQGKSCDTLANKIHPEGLQVDDKQLKPEYSFESGEETEQDAYKGTE